MAGALGLILPHYTIRGGGSTSRLGGRELTLLCGFNQYTLLQNRDNSGLLGTLLYCSLKLGGRCPPNAQVGGAAAPPAPPVEPPLTMCLLLCTCTSCICSDVPNAAHVLSLSETEQDHHPKTCRIRICRAVKFWTWERMRSHADFVDLIVALYT